MAGSASSVAAGNITGTIPLAQLPASVLTNGASDVSINGTFSGDGTGVTNVNLLNVNNEGSMGWATNYLYYTNFSYNGFILSSSPGVGNFPSSVCAADVNGDGKVDLISANQDANSLTVLTNNGSGGFVISSSPGVGGYPISVCAADVNGDGKMDLICANNADDTLTVLTNNGNGGFVIASSPGVGHIPICVCAADVNGDGKVDLICANQGASSLTVLTNNGSGGFVIASSPGVGGASYSCLRSGR